MKIEGPGGPNQIRYTGKVSRTNKSSESGRTSFSDQLSSMDETSGTSASSEAQAVSNVDQLLGLQEVNDALSGRSQARQYGNNILDLLDNLRLQILEGQISKEQLIRIAKSVSARRAATSDPQIIEILDEIDLRAQVEIAKFMRDQESA